MNITQTIFMFKQYSRSPLFWKSIGEFWMLTIFFGILLYALQGIIPKLCKTVFDTLNWENHIPFFLLIICFGLLITNTIRIAYKLKTVQWKPWDAFIIAYCLYASQTFAFVKVDSLEFFWNLLENSLVFTFICLASLYLIIKSTSGIITLINALPKKARNSNNNQQDQDLSLDNIAGFDDITDLKKLRELDKLGRFDHAQQISHIINNIKPEKSFAIGINGEWGSGKTSFIHLIRRINQIEYPKHCKFITFNPWYFTGTEKVLIKFHETLLSEVGHFSLSLRNELDRYFKLICTVEKTLWKTNFLQIFQQKPDFQSQLEKLKAHFEKLPQKIVIIIDDMDRLQKDEILVLFRTMRLIADFPNVIYLVGYDPEYIKTMLGEKLNDNKSSFMEKVFQVQFTLPQAIDIHLKAIWDEKIQKVSTLETEAISKLTNVIFENKLIDNLRDIKRFFNFLRITYILPDIKNNTYFPHFILIEFIAYKYPNLYQKIKKHKNEITIDNKENKPTFESDLVKNEDTLYKLFRITKQIAQQSSSPFITNAQSFDKYFNIRLHPENDINIEDVKDCLIQEDAKDEFTYFYEKSKDQLILYLDQIFSKSPLFDENIIKESSIKYIIQVFRLTYNEKHFDYNYFKRPDNDDSKLLINTAKNILNSELKTFGNEIFEAYYGDISFVYFLGQLAKKDRDINNFPIADIFKKCLERFIHDKNIYKLIISFYIYQDSCISDRYFHQNFFKEFLKINELFLKDNSANILEITTEFNESKKIKISFPNLFGSFENLLILNDLKNKDIFKMLDEYGKYYPIDKKDKCLSYSINPCLYSHDYRVQLPLSSKKATVLLEDNQEIKTINLNFDNIQLHSYEKDNQSPLEVFSSNYAILIFNAPNSISVWLINLETNKPREEYNLQLFDSIIPKVEIIIESEKEESFTLECIDKSENKKTNSSISIKQALNAGVK